MFCELCPIVGSPCSMCQELASLPAPAPEPPNMHSTDPKELHELSSVLSRLASMAYHRARWIEYQGKDEEAAEAHRATYECQARTLPGYAQVDEMKW